MQNLMDIYGSMQIAKTEITAQVEISAPNLSIHRISEVGGSRGGQIRVRCRVVSITSFYLIHDVDYEAFGFTPCYCYGYYAQTNRYANQTDGEQGDASRLTGCYLAAPTLVIWDDDARVRLLRHTVRARGE